jgi:imidazole glycerol-phosphate synthase subunit HisH
LIIIIKITHIKMINYKKKINICILNYGSGNISSVNNALKFLGYKTKISNSIENIEKSTHMILPGVGAFDTSMKKINQKLPISFLKNEILNKKKPFLGICVGMQVLAKFGYEFNKTNGLNLINGNVIKIKSKKIKLPHIGWNKILMIKKHSVLDGLDGKDFYFVHSFYFDTKTKSYVIANTKYNHNFPSIINKNNIYGVQFHPEKSLTNGLKFLNNFILNT